ncbi:ABC transporter permease subunit [Halovulum dunhuangense]|uniref:ABC transporter permease subunit n=1 Tax=Halovulum dunhuangense TaxID=1505036 RepID=A0A849L3A6_9RHOB|nr:ABC transporter permease subunit [Halovulum dunhuangense]NNU80868.1 ABC transporter permease subunit [Halovulum dunhuangense]
MLGPVAAGLLFTLLPAIGYMPSVGATTLGLAPFGMVFDWPGLPQAARLSVTTGLLATSLALAVTVLLVAGLAGTRAFRLIERLLSPLLSVPHAAAAFGLAFLIAPSGWLVRSVSPWATGWEQPPDLLILQDPWGLSLVAGLVAKEVPFLLLMTLAALPQAQADARLTVARSLGYGRVNGWLKAVFPAVYAQIRLPVYVVLAYSMSVVDVAMILGPNTPPTLSVQILRWMNDPDLTMRQCAAAAALLQLALVLGALLLWRLGERALARFGRRRIAAGRRGLSIDPLARGAGLALGAGSALAVLLGLVALGVWSLAARWSYPDLLPEGFTLRSWMRHGSTLADTGTQTILIAVIATALALVLTIGCLESETRRGARPGQGALLLLYLPLLIPQAAFLPGLQFFLLGIGGAEGVLPVIAAHLVFVLPYVFLSLSDPWRAWDRRYAVVAGSLGAGPAGVLWRVRLPMLLRAVLTAAAVGMAVSVGQYLPTLLIGGGRVGTLTTEAVALAAGGDRRAIGVFGILQTLLALLPFGLALAIPALVFRNRRGLRHG